MNGKDSRLIDMANYGELIVKNSILQQGNNTSNSQLIAYGLERNVERLFKTNRVELTNNLIFYDRQRANVLIKKRLDDEFIVKSNVFVGDFNDSKSFKDRNHWYFDRKSAKLQPYPYLPAITERQNIIDKIKIFGTAKY